MTKKDKESKQTADKDIEIQEPKEPKKQEQKVEEQQEQVIEIPVNLNEFYGHLSTARQHIAFSQDSLGDSEVYAEFVKQLEAVNCTLGDVETRIRQIKDLNDVLASTKFTNKDDINQKICKRVIEEITKHFKFKKIDEIDEDDDLIVIDDDRPSKSLSKSRSGSLPKSSSRDLSSISNLRAEAREEARSELGGMMSMYQNAANQHYGEVSDDFYGNLPEDLDGMTIEEVKATFPDIDSATLKKVEQLKRLAPSRKMSSTGGTGLVTRRES